MIIDPKNIAVNDLHQFILGAVAPRPIAFVSTVDENGIPNLAPYSFFNAFSSNPPILVFSSNRRVGNNTTKDTLHNVQVTRQCVIQVVTHDIVRQMALSSIDYPAEVDEFKKAGFTPLPSIHVKAFRVKESPVQMECEVQDIITLGDHGGAGHLVICRVLCMHVDERVLDENQRIDPDKIDLMGRLGRAYYARASGAAVETIYQPFNEIGIGFDQLPDAIRLSPILTGNEIAEFAALTHAPVLSEEDHDYVKNLSRNEVHLKVRELLLNKDIEGAARLAWADIARG
jgi:flavin reductase (DIM6/NTAB) family NADH-FMN oxidoreductase RutF